MYCVRLVVRLSTDLKVSTNIPSSMSALLELTFGHDTCSYLEGSQNQVLAISIDGERDQLTRMHRKQLASGEEH